MIKKQVRTKLTKENETTMCVCQYVLGTLTKIVSGGDIF